MVIIARATGGTTKSAIRHKLTSTGGQVYVDEGIAPWVKYLIEGRGPVVAKKAKALHFCIAGNDIFVKRVGPSKPNDIMQKGYVLSLPSVGTQAEELGNWLNEV